VAARPPEAAVAKVGPKGVVGILVSHQWDVAGEDACDTNMTAAQYFYTLNLKDGWLINGAPIFSYNHEATSGNRWTFPLAIGVTKTTFIGGRPWKFGVQYWHSSSHRTISDPIFRFVLRPRLW